ncbi:MAG TPA: DivIVA domain-containing protein [Gemmatimonadota bacterium]|nr:DivIVA domain-containing protein [Gemmatimonadota bacterium]
MSLTPLDVKKQEFDKVFRGYDPVAVDAFLELVSEEMAELVMRVNGLEERLLAVQSTVDDYRQMEQALKETMANAKRQAEDAREAAVREGELSKREAKVESDRMVADAERRRASLEQRIEELESTERDFVRRLKVFLDEHRRTLEAHPLLVVEQEPGRTEKRGGP